MTRGAEATPSVSTVLEAAGKVEFAHADETTWHPAPVGTALAVRDRVRTAARSRAALQFSDRSVLRLAENTTLQIQPPRAQEKRRFNLLQGLLYFFNRENPADVEFETPIATGAIRGTEFVLGAGTTNGSTYLALLDGAVELTAAGQSVALNRGELATVVPGQPPVRSPLLEAQRVVQWALYYPTVVVLADLGLSTTSRPELTPVLTAYAQGDIAAARLAMEAVPTGDESVELWRASLNLAVGETLTLPPVDSLPAALRPIARALEELVGVIRGDHLDPRALPQPTLATEWLARSYTEQSAFRLVAAVAAAERATQLAPENGLAWSRRAELELALERWRPARASLAQALRWTPRFTPALTAQGFLLLEEHRPTEALAAFDAALALDPAVGSAWLGRGLALSQRGDRAGALLAFQNAAALEPRRALHRSLLGKAYSRAGAVQLAEKEFRLGRELDPADPTAWFYTALHEWQELRPNSAVADLERSVELNDHRQLYRSRLGLDRELAVRSANLAALYRDGGLPEAGLQAASRAVADDYANYSAHLFLARSYQQQADPARIDLRREAARQSEFAVANLLAPAGVDALSHLVLQAEHVEWFDPRPVGVTSFTEYRSAGDWRQEGSLHGALDGFSYALDHSLVRRHGEEPNGWLEREDISLQLKQRVTERDDVWFQAGFADGRQGDLARRYDPATADRGFHATEEQWPNLRLGWHRAWSASSHTLLLVGRLTDSLETLDPERDVLFLRQSAGQPTSLSSAPFFASRFGGDFTLYSAELQHLWQGNHHTLVAGGRYQAGDVENTATLERALTGPVTDQRVDESLERVSFYAYENWQVAEPLRLIAGLSYDRLRHPANSDLPPLNDGTTEREQVSPKVGFWLTPWRGGTLRAAYTRSLGGVYFDNNLQLEPAQVAGFVQNLRSLAPESVVGLVPGATFESAQLSFVQRFASQTHAGFELGWNHSDGDREVGLLTNSLPLPVPNAPSSAQETVDFRERVAGVFVVQSWGAGWNMGVRYRLAEATLHTEFPQLPATLPGLSELERNERATLHEVTLSLAYQHAAGWFARWESHWYGQQNFGYTPARLDESLWQHELWAGWRGWQRRFTAQVGLLNLTGQDYRLNPLNETARLARARTLVVSLRLDF